MVADSIFSRWAQRQANVESVNLNLLVSEMPHPGTAKSPIPDDPLLTMNCHGPVQSQRRADPRLRQVLWQETYDHVRQCVVTDPHTDPMCCQGPAHQVAPSRTLDPTPGANLQSPVGSGISCRLG